jgi:hypothetical protein
MECAFYLLLLWSLNKNVDLMESSVEDRNLYKRFMLTLVIEIRRLM